MLQSVRLFTFSRGVAACSCHDTAEQPSKLSTTTSLERAGNQSHRTTAHHRNLFSFVGESQAALGPSNNTRAVLSTSIAHAGCGWVRCAITSARRGAGLDDHARGDSFGRNNVVPGRMRVVFDTGVLHLLQVGVLYFGVEVGDSTLQQGLFSFDLLQPLRDVLLRLIRLDDIKNKARDSNYFSKIIV